MLGFMSKPVAKNIILIGQVGAGKSRIAELVSESPKGKLSGGLADGASHTRNLKPVRSPDGLLKVIDTPGAMGADSDDVLDHNTEIMKAINFASKNGGISAVVLCVKADVNRSGGTCQELSPLFRRFIKKLPLIRFCVTHMDEVKYANCQVELQAAMTKRFGVPASTMFFKYDATTPMQLRQGLLGLCTPTPQTWLITEDSFLDYFDIKEGDNAHQVMIAVQDEVIKFKKYVDMFNFWMQSQTPSPQTDDAVFEFQAWLKNQMVESQKSVAQQCGFSLLDSKTIWHEAGHLANLTNQLKDIVVDISVMAMMINSANAEIVSGLECRACPHCGLTWMKVSGCNGGTTCGNRPDPGALGRASFFNWSFSFSGGKLSITTSGEKSWKKATTIKPSSGPKNQFRDGKAANDGGGCGASINWSEMRKVALPAEALCGEVGVIVDQKKDEALKQRDIVAINSTAQAGAHAWHTLWEEMNTSKDADDYSPAAFEALFSQ